MECHSAELKKAKYIREHSEAKLKTLELEAKLTDAALSQIGLGTLCFIHSLEELWAMIAYSLWSISQWT
jgi:hypothetical protein